MKTVAKTESLAEFIARGGSIKVCPAKNKARKREFKNKFMEMDTEEVDFSLLPEHLKIRLGIRG